MAGLNELPSKVFFFFYSSVCRQLRKSSGSSEETWESFDENDQTDKLAEKFDFAFQRCFR